MSVPACSRAWPRRPATIRSRWQPVCDGRSHRSRATELARVQCPVLVILGDRDFAGPAEPLVDALPDARLVTLRGIDHFQSTRDFACIDAALEFIDAVPT